MGDDQFGLLFVHVKLLLISHIGCLQLLLQSFILVSNIVHDDSLVLKDGDLLHQVLNRGIRVRKGVLLTGSNQRIIRVDSICRLSRCLRSRSLLLRLVCIKRSRSFLLGLTLGRLLGGSSAIGAKVFLLENLLGWCSFLWLFVLHFYFCRFTMAFADDCIISKLYNLNYYEL